MAERFAERVVAEGARKPKRGGTEVTTDADQVTSAFRLALGREPDADELALLVEYCTDHGLANTCRLIFNTNEFLFVD
jgi:hypothetical protein